jgi:glycosyltransferase involved in cell wall biosynthesis
MVFFISCAFQTNILGEGEGGPGCLNDISHPGALADQWKWLADPALRIEYANAARAHAEAQFSEQAVLKQILAMYRDVMGGANL